MLTTNNYTIRINSKCSGNNLPSGSSSDFVFTSSTTLPEIELKGTYTGSGIVFGKPSYNIRDYINTFVFNAQGNGGDKMTPYLGAAVVAAAADGPLPIGDIIGAGIIGYGAYKALTAGKGNSSYPGPWSYTYQHPSQNPIHNPPSGWNPEEPPKWGGAVKWGLIGLGAYRVYDEYQQRMNEIGVKPYVAPRDNTNVIQPQFIPYRPR
ncbi:MAG: hypothetical protein IT237_07085 [Bacteroidia bacterium]|nr:hypothetical protein [Bacteroidia bacterium]